MALHKAGYKILRNEIIIIIILIGLTFIFNTILILILLCDFLLLLAFSLFFFRVPKRIMEREEGKVYAPCDGKVVVIEETIESEFFKDKRLQISIFMSPLNVHNNLYPINGDIVYTKYHPGKFLVAWNPKASTDNERNTIVVKNKRISILCRQIAGAVARRIVSYPVIGDTANISEEFGFIKFGSRVDIFLPIGTKINTTLRAKVKGGLTVIASY